MKPKLHFLANTVIVSAFIILMPALTYAQDLPDSQSPNSSTHSRGIISTLLEEPAPLSIIYPYEDNYFVYSVTNELNREAISDRDWAKDARDREVEYQISLAIPLTRGLLGSNSVLAMSYTQSCWWQACHDKISSPFRETNYQPQLFMGWATDFNINGWSVQELEAGYVHQSNGQSNPASHGWNRIYVRCMAQKDDWQIDFKPWFLIGDPRDNRDITKYLGYYRLKVSYHPGDHLFAFQGHYNWNTGYGNIKLAWSYPISKNTRFYTQVFSGYGESLIDYNYNQTRFAVGLLLNTDLL